MSKKRVNKNCESCRYFVPKSGFMGNAICLRYPRQAVSSKGWVFKSEDVKWAYPSTQPTDICGEWVYNNNKNDSKKYEWRFHYVEQDEDADDEKDDDNPKSYAWPTNVEIVEK